MITAVIPCHNEAHSIGDIVIRAKKYCQRVIVIDNNSTDETAEVAENAGAEVHSCWTKGVGRATDLGFEYANDDAIVVTLDGDGQHDPDEINKVIKPILKGEADLVIGTRYTDIHYMPRYRRIGVDIITLAYNFGHRFIHDGQSGFRAYSGEVVRALKPIQENGFSFSVETLVRARAKGFRIGEVPITCLYHQDFKLNSSMNPIRHGVSLLCGVLKWRMKLEFTESIKKALFALIKIGTRPLVGKGLGKQVLLRAIYAKITQVLIPEIDKVVKVNGFLVRVATDFKGLDGTTATLVAKNDYEPLTTRAFKSILREDMGVVDVGANIGYFTLLSSKLVSNSGKVWAAEPEPHNLSSLKANIELNHFNNIVIVDKAITDYDGIAKFFVSKSESGEHSLIGGRSHIKDTINVITSRLDNVVNGEKVNLIKVDTEGNEYSVLKGARETILANKDIKVITEVWFPGVIASGHQPIDLWRLLIDYGFMDFYVLDEIGRKIYAGNAEYTLKKTEERCHSGKFSINLLSSRSMIDELEK
jgi:FkbM family methyltransferase